MSILSESLDSTLAGVLVDIDNDYAQDYDTTKWGKTESVVIIGTAFDGISSAPVKVYSEEHARFLFGDIYDEASHKEATLVAGIADALRAGCTTVYGYRIGGKIIYKDFDFCVGNTDLKLRLSQLYPSNKGKNCYVLFDKTAGQESVSFYKPSDRATIKERRRGYTADDSTMLVTKIKLNEGNGITKDSRLTEMLEAFNNNVFNNVLRLSVVDANGTDRTNSAEARDLCVGAMHSGLYMIGRDANAAEMVEYTEVNHALILDSGDSKPYRSYQGKHYQNLLINTDVRASVPVYAQNYSDLALYLNQAGIATAREWDFLEVEGVLDKAFLKDAADYEEVDLTPFEIYKKLGSGFAVTATAERRVTRKPDGSIVETTPKIRETPQDDPNRITALTDGEYSILQNAAIRYRVLTCAAADEKIAGVLPKAKDFETTVGASMTIFNNLVKVTKLVDPNHTFSPKSYQFSFKNLDSTDTANQEDLEKEHIITVISYLSDLDCLRAMAVEPGTLFFVEHNAKTKLVRINRKGQPEIVSGAKLDGAYYAADKKVYIGKYDKNAADEIDKLTFEPAQLDQENKFNGKAYALLQANGELYAGRVYDESGAFMVDPLGDIETMLTDNEEKTVIYVEDLYGHLNTIDIDSAIFDAVTLEEMVTYLNRHKQLGQLFSYALTEKGAENKDAFVLDLFVNENGIPVETVVEVMNESHRRSYDYSRYIPYRTTDNFARQLAQHATYTDLLTYPTHGIIGCKKFTDFSIPSIQNRVEELLEFVKNDADLYAKTYAGRYLAAGDGSKYEIGKNISITFFENYVTDTKNAYKFVANGATAYAGMIAKIGPYQSSTCQQIAINETLFVPTYTQLQKLTEAGIVTVKNSFTKGLIVTDGITMAPPDSLFRRLLITRTMYIVSDLIRSAAEKYIGLPNNLSNRNSLKTAVKSNLDTVLGTLIDSYDFAITNEETYTTNSYIDIAYTFVPINEIREVRNNITVKASS